MTESDIYHAMDVQVPAMRQRGFTIGTAAGQISIAPGWIAERLAQQLTQHLQCELLRQTRDRALQKASISEPDTLLNRRKADQHEHCQQPDPARAQPG